MKTENIPFQKYSCGPLQPYGNALFWDKKFWKQNTARSDNSFFFFFFQNMVNKRKKSLFTEKKPRLQNRVWLYFAELEQ